MSTSIQFTFPTDLCPNSLTGFQETSRSANTVTIQSELSYELRKAILLHQLWKYPLVIRNPTTELCDLLSDIPFDDIELKLGDEHFKLESLEQVRTLRQLTVENRDDVDFSALESLTELETLSIQNISCLTELSQLPPLANLSMLSIDSCTNLVSLSGLRTPKLAHLDVDHCESLKDYSPLAKVTSLTALALWVDDRLPPKLRELQKALPDLTVFAIIGNGEGKITKCYESHNKCSERADKFLSEEE